MSNKNKRKARKAGSERQARNLMITLTAVFLVLMILLWAASSVLM